MGNKHSESRHRKKPEGVRHVSQDNLYQDIYRWPQYIPVEYILLISLDIETWQGCCLSTFLFNTTEPFSVALWLTDRVLAIGW